MDFKSYKFNSVLIGILALLAIPTMFHISQWAETKYFPVISNFQITSMETTVEGYPILSGTVTRERQCKLEDVIFVDRSSSFDSPIGSALPETTDPNRPPGNYHFGPWVLYTDVNTLKTQSYIRAIYNCHPFYKTITYIPLSGVLTDAEN